VVLCYCDLIDLMQPGSSRVAARVCMQRGGRIT
jgi:hypothetical protein